MTSLSYAAGLGRLWGSPVRDMAVSLLTRDPRWRKALIRQMAPRAKDIVAEVGCGTGALAVMLKSHAASVSVYGFDPDPVALDIAERRARAASALVNYTHATKDDIGAKLAALRPAHIVSTLLFHRVPLNVKQDLLAAMYQGLQSGGQLHIADYGWQRTALMRSAFGLVQSIEGKACAQPNADGCMPVLIHKAGFERVMETTVIPTLTGSISIYRATKP